MSGLARAAFWVLACIVLLAALAPGRVAPNILPDKVQHFLSFAVLAFVGAAAWRRRSLLILGIGPIALGGAIELLQATPFINRDAEVGDWLADALGTLVVLLPVAFYRGRRS